MPGPAEVVQGKGGSCHSIDRHYRRAIDGFLSKHMAVAGCLYGCRFVREQYPELRLVRGLVNLTGVELAPEEWHDVDLFVHGIENILAPHFWLETETGEIVDPTESQFTDPNGCYRRAYVHSYIPFPETLADKLPIGKCCHCGLMVYPGQGDSMLHDNCSTAYAAYVIAEAADFGF